VVVSQEEGGRHVAQATRQREHKDGDFGWREEGLARLPLVFCWRSQPARTT